MCIENDVPAVLYTGELPGRERREALVLFSSRAAGCKDVLLMSKSSGGTGLNLRADAMLFLSPGVNQAVDDQAKSRVVRMGQRHAVDVVYLVFEAYMDQFIWNQKKNKLAIGTMFVGDSNDRLQDLFGCSTDEVSAIIQRKRVQQAARCEEEEPRDDSERQAPSKKRKAELANEDQPPDPDRPKEGKKEKKKKKKEKKKKKKEKKAKKKQEKKEKKEKKEKEEKEKVLAENRRKEEVERCRRMCAWLEANGAKWQSAPEPERNLLPGCPSSTDFLFVFRNPASIATQTISQLDQLGPFKEAANEFPPKNEFVQLITPPPIGSTIS